MPVNNGANGTIQITHTKNKKVHFKDVIHTAILLKSNISQFKVKQWPNELIYHKPLATQYEQFAIHKREWLTDAKIFVVPTIIFGKTKIEINLNEHVLLGTGFTIEVYYRTGTIKKSIKTTNKVTTSFGGTIEINFQWHFNNKEHIPSIKFKNNH